ncbi:MAG: hypothetical protein U0M15_09305 [Bacillota bacterium]|nr:hypothetical protein [Bacillota bacterium]
MKKFGLLLAAMLCILIFAACGESAAQDRTPVDFSQWVMPEQGSESVELGSIDGHPYYYDPIYHFKAWGGALSGELEDNLHWALLVYEVCALEAKYLGAEISQEDIDREINRRKQDFESTPQRIADYEADLEAGDISPDITPEGLRDNLALERETYEKQKQYMEECMSEDNLTEEEFWQSLEPYAEKSLYSSEYINFLEWEYEQAAKKNKDLSQRGFYEEKFKDLFVLYHVECDVEGEPNFSQIFLEQ